MTKTSFKFTGVTSVLNQNLEEFRIICEEIAEQLYMKLSGPTYRQQKKFLDAALYHKSDDSRFVKIIFNNLTAEITFEFYIYGNENCQRQLVFQTINNDVVIKIRMSSREWICDNILPQ